MSEDGNAKALEVMRSGISKVSLNDGNGKKNRPPIYVEAYVPIVDGPGGVRGVVEVYIDQTNTASLFKTSFAALSLALALAGALAFGLSHDGLSPAQQAGQRSPAAGGIPGSLRADDRIAQPRQLQRQTGFNPAGRGAAARAWRWSCLTLTISR